MVNVAFFLTWINIMYNICIHECIYQTFYCLLPTYMWLGKKVYLKMTYDK